MPLNAETLAKMPPGPYSWAIKGNFLYLIDGTGKKIATLLGTSETRNALLDFIIAAERHKDALPVHD
ncbi:MAG: hypothetical protein WDN10_00105 [bacterium]